MKKTAGALILFLAIFFISNCENPVQGYILTDLYGPKYNLEVKKLTEADAFNYGTSVDIYGDYIIVGAPAGKKNSANKEAAYVYHRTGVDEWEGPFELPQPSDWAAGDRFGFSVSIYGDFAAVSAPEKTVGGKQVAGAVYIYRRKADTANQWEEVKRITKADQTGTYTYPVKGSEQFGYSVKLYDKWLLVGAPGDDLNGDDSNTNDSNYGAVYRFKYNGTDWEYDYFFSNNTPLTGAQFGTAMDVSSSYAVIGAPGEDIDGKSKVGSIYIYSFNNGKFEFKQRISNTANYTGNDDYFGGSISLSGDFLAAGVGGAIVDNIFFTGDVQVYMLEGGSWSNTPTILLHDEQADYDFFGFTVAVKQVDDKNYILATGSVNRDNGDSADAGAVYIYTGKAGTNSWTLQKELMASDSSANSYFGRSIALGDDYAVIGASHLYDYFENGRVYIFR